MKRIYADFNDFAGDQTLPLTCVGSVDSIAALADSLEEGEEVLLSGGWEARGTWAFSAASREVMMLPAEWSTNVANHQLRLVKRQRSSY